MAGDRLRQPARGVFGAWTPQCLSAAELAMITGSASVEAGRLLDHVARCDYCGAQLKLLMEMKTTNSTPAEGRALQELQSTGERRAVRQPRKGASKPGFSRWGYAAAGLVVVALAAGWWYQRGNDSPERLLASSYSGQRTVEMRFTGARYGPLKQERGAAGRSQVTRRPLILLEAEALIGRRLAAHPEAPEWLQAEARVELLDRHYEAAIQSLRHALRIQPESPSLLIDLASAYFERAEAMDRTIDYGQTIELLGKGLALQPENHVALFNRAIAQERMFLFHQAITDWELYLKEDRSGDWAAEARQRLATLQRKTDLHDASDQPVGDPATFLRAVGGSPVDTRVEDYLQAAIDRWLPEAFPLHGTPSDAEASRAVRKALAVLSSLLKSRHGDGWLSDLLEASSSPATAAALSHLSQSVHLNAEGDPVGARQESEAATQLFASSGNMPGALRSRLESVYALDRSIKGEACLKAAEAVRRDLGSRPYRWIRGQLSIEFANCRAQVGDLGGAKADAADALAESRAAGFGTLELRSLGIASEQDGRSGNLLAAWSKNRSGLARYWQAAFPSMRAYQFQSDLRRIAEGRNQHYLALGLAREAAFTATATPNRSIEAMARYQLANLAGTTDSAAEAERQFMQADQLFARLPQNSVTRSYRLRGEISLAELQSERGEFSAPVDRLNRLRQEVEQLDSPPLALSFFASLGKLYRARGSNREAEDAFQKAWRLMEQGKQSLRSGQERILWARQGGEAYRSLVGIRVRQGGDAEQLLDLWESYRSERPISQPGGLHAALPSLLGQTLISYAESSDGLVVWVADDRGVSATWVPAPVVLVERVAHQFVERCADATTPADLLRRDGNQLYRWLIKPIEERLLPGRTLVIEPDGAIARVPLQALVDDRGRYLGERYSIIWSPGVWLNGLSRPAERRVATFRALVVGPPVLEGDMAAAFPPLPDAMQEARSVAMRFPAATFLAGREATLDAVERDLPAAELLHFAGHGFSNASGSGLILATEGQRETAVLEASQIRPEQVRKCQIVVLSACSTGTGNDDEYVDPDGLAAAFLRAGVRTVVAARWRIDSKATSILMNEFYEALFAGKPAEEALRNASAKLRGRTETAHPFYWAAFGAFGSRSFVK